MAASAKEKQQSIDTAHTLTLTNTKLDRVPQCQYSLNILRGRPLNAVSMAAASVVASAVSCQLQRCSRSIDKHADTLTLTNHRRGTSSPPMSMFFNSGPPSMPSPWQQRVWPRRLQREMQQSTRTRMRSHSQTQKWIEFPQCQCFLIRSRSQWSPSVPMAAVSVAASATEMQQSIDIHTRTRSHSQIHKSIDFSQCQYFLIRSRCERRRVGYRDAAVNRHTHTDALALTNTQVDRLLPMSIFSNLEPL